MSIVGLVADVVCQPYVFSLRSMRWPVPVNCSMTTIVNVLEPAERSRAEVVALGRDQALPKDRALARNLVPEDVRLDGVVCVSSHHLVGKGRIRYPHILACRGTP